ncbi:Ref family recombination enhancement nuclease [Ensifer sp. SSB1]|uniref:Ref family recombination enhancement nuclease n=1 Tax=Ensifer sp. SSB1 TaxID=2795385 RepID=UPI001A3CDAA2|nr:Ref family recombination enhancement nuclease [Ensifer sp. SSB1]MBK5571793.1 hypothetical protein [Ensifer sp. SSB1]
MLARRTPMKRTSGLKQGAGLQRTAWKKKGPKRKPKANRDHMGAVAALPCVVCLRLGYETYGVQVHHLKEGQGTARADDKDTMPLCEPHHTGPLGVHGLGTKGFPKHYGFTERDLLADTRRLLGL